jgi:hypothetical protein
MTVDKQSREHNDPGTPLELRVDADGPRHYLAGKPVRSGDVLEVEFNGAHITGLYQWSGNPKDQPQLFYFDQHALAVRSVDLAQMTPLRWPAQADEWTALLLNPRTLDAAEQLLQQLINEAQAPRPNLCNVATHGDLRKLLCEFQLLRRKAAATSQERA